MSKTLVDVLLIKAAATHQLSNFAISGLSCNSAMLLAADSATSTPLRLVRNTILRAVIARAGQRTQPTAITRLFDTARDAGTVVGGMGAVLLSERERESVRAFIRDLSITDVTASLFISDNTDNTR